MSTPEPITIESCHCHDAAAADEPVIDVRTLPHEIRHGAVIGSFTSLQPGRALVIVAPHDPLPLLDQLKALVPVGIDYLGNGPDEWRIRLTRQ